MSEQKDGSDGASREEKSMSKESSAPARPSAAEQLKKAALDAARAEQASATAKSVPGADAASSTGEGKAAEEHGGSGSGPATATPPAGTQGQSQAGQPQAQPQAQASPQAQAQPQAREPQMPPQAAVAAVAPEPAGSPNNSLAWLAIVIGIAVAVGLFYLMLDLQRRESALLQRVQSLEAVSGQGDTTLEQLGSNLRRQLELEIEALQARQQRGEADLERALQNQRDALARLEARAPADINRTELLQEVRSAVAQDLRPLQQSLQRQESQLLDQQQRINDLTIEDRDNWQLAEAQYLLRLANQRLIMTGDTVSAEALLRSADNLLRGLDDATLHDLRAAVTADLAAVRAVPRLDIQGLYLRLDALIRQTDDLVLFKFPEREPVETAPLEDADWTDRVVQGYEIALQKLSDYVVVTRTDVPVEALMDPQYEGLVRQNMRMLLEQAQVAMLSGNELLFRQSLERASGWVSEFFKSDEQAAVAMKEELAAISAERVNVELPDLSRSMQALEAAMRLRLSRSGN